MNKPQKINPADIAAKLLNPENFHEEEKKRLAANKKKELNKKVASPPTKQYYDVKIECMLPAVLTYRILAEDAQQAAQLIRGQSPHSVQHKLIGRKELVLKVFDSGSNMMRFVKKLFGG